MDRALAAERLARVRAACAENDWAGLIVYGNAWRCDYLRYVSDFPILEGHGFALVRADENPVLILESPIEAERASVEASDCEIVFAPDIFAEVNARIARMGRGPLALAPFGLCPQGIAVGDNIVPADDVLNQLLMNKTEREIEKIRQAAELADRGYEVFMQAARPGRTEYELVADVEAFFRAEGCPDNFMIVGSGGPEVRGMHPPGDRRLQAGDLVTTELTPCIDGYYAQLCRTLVIGEASPEQEDAFSIYLEAMESGIAATRPGVTAAEIARIENDVFRARNLGEYTTSKYTRVRGHGLGIYLDTPPAILEDVDIPLADGMTIIVHPNTYNPTVGYIVLGDSLVVREGGPEILSKTPRRLFQVGA